MIWVKNKDGSLRRSEVFLPRHWKKRRSCRVCTKRKKHRHWSTMHTLVSAHLAIKRTYTSRIIEMMKAPSPLSFLIKEPA